MSLGHSLRTNLLNMEPVATLSVISNVLQLVDFGARVLSKGNRTYHSEIGRLSEDEDLELVTSDLLMILSKL